MNQTKAGNDYLETPYSKLFFKNEAGELMTPRDAKWVPSRGDEYGKMKTRGLNPACFSETEYFPPDLSSEILTSAEIAIRVIDFGEDGSLETYELFIDPFIDEHPERLNLSFDGSRLPNDKVPNTGGNYDSIKDYLSQLQRNQLKHSGSAVTHRKMPSETPTDKTPFHQGFDQGYTGRNGFVYFYLLADERIKFVQETPAFYAHIPETIQTLYSPYFQDEVGFNQLDNPQVLALRFYRHNTMVNDVTTDPVTGDINCEYPYDIAVIADGQDTPDGQGGIIEVETPLLIDPNTGTRGSAP